MILPILEPFAMDAMLPRVRGKDFKLALGIERRLSLVLDGSTDLLLFHSTSGDKAQRLGLGQAP